MVLKCVHGLELPDPVGLYSHVAKHYLGTKQFPTGFNTVGTLRLELLKLTYRWGCISHICLLTLAIPQEWYLAGRAFNVST